MKKIIFFSTAFLFTSPFLRAWTPAEWIHIEGKHAYEHATEKWFWLEEAENPWVYAFPPGSGGWLTLSMSGLQGTWAYHVWPYAYAYHTDNWYYLHPDAAPSAFDVERGKWSVLGETIIDDSLATDTISVSMKQNGNLNNRGLGIHDDVRGRHLYSVGQSVRAFDPSTGETSTVFTLEHGGRPVFLNVHGDEIYFIEERKGHLMKYVIPEDRLAVLNESLHDYAGRNQNSLLVNQWQEGFVEGWSLRRWSITGGSFGSLSVNNIEHLNIGVARIWYTLQGQTTIMMRDSFSGFGRTDIARLGNDGVEEIHEKVMDRSDDQPLFALILEKNDQQGLYFYQVEEGHLEGELIPVLVDEGLSLHSLAFNGTHFYFIRESESGDSRIYRVHKDGEPVEKVVAPEASAVNLNLVNHWLYFADRETNLLHRLHPVTGEVETLRE